MARQTAIGRISDRPVAPGQVNEIHGGLSIDMYAGGYNRKRAVITVSTAADSTSYTFTVQGKDKVNQAVTITSDADATKQEIRDLLYLKTFDHPELGKRLLFKKDPESIDKLIVAAIESGDDFAISEADGNLALAITQNAGSGQNMPFGRGVFQDAANREIARLMEASQTLLGVTQRSETENDGSGNTYIAGGSGVKIRIQGAIVVELDASTTSPVPGDQVFCRTAGTANGEQGQFRVDNTDGSPVAVGGARWYTGALNGLGDTRCAVLILSGMG